MRRHKARRAAAQRARDPRRVDKLGGDVGSEAILENPSLQSVYLGHECIGFLLARGPRGIEAYDAAEHSLGIFKTLKEAADAITRAAGECHERR